ncbi:hypothetical protein ACSU64_12290 [Bacillaceae bacterium C204]|uniref:hypothetical protein n=1 Tax=Neobacillus sp. 204 TaxID=3383351 RepID=UPI003979CA6F
MLKLIVDFGTLLIGVEGARSSKMLSHFLRAVLIRRSLFNVLREDGAGETPQERSDEEAPRTAREPHAPGTEINRQVKRAYLLIKYFDQN